MILLDVLNLTEQSPLLRRSPEMPNIREMFRKMGWLLLESLFSSMNRRRALYIFLSVLALFLVGTVVVLSSITYYLAIDPNAYLSDLEIPIHDNETTWDPVEHGAVQYVPKIIHQTWKTETLPLRWQNLSQGCRDIMPD